MPISAATFTSCCGLGVAVPPPSTIVMRHHQQHRHPHRRQHPHSPTSSSSAASSVGYYTTMSPPPAASAAASDMMDNRQLHAGNRQPANGLAITDQHCQHQQQQPRRANLVSLRRNQTSATLQLQPAHQPISYHHHHHHQRAPSEVITIDDSSAGSDSVSVFEQQHGPIVGGSRPCYSSSSTASAAHQHSSSFGSSSLSFSLLSSRSPRLDRLLLLPVAASSPSITPRADQRTNIAAGVRLPPPSTSRCCLNPPQHQNNNNSTLMDAAPPLASSSNKPLHHPHPQNHPHQDDGSSCCGDMDSDDLDSDDVSVCQRPLKPIIADRAAAAAYYPSAATTAMTTPSGTINSRVDLMKQANNTRSASIMPHQPLHPSSVENNRKSTATAKKSSSFMAWSKRIVAALHGNSASSTPAVPPSQANSNCNDAAVTTSSTTTTTISTPSGEKLARRYKHGKSSANIDMQQQQQQQQQQQLRQTVSSARIGGFMDTIPEVEQRAALEKFLFVPSPQSHILPQSPYHKTDPGQMRSFFKSKSAAAFREMTANHHHQQQQQQQFNSSSSGCSSIMGVSSPLRYDPVSLLLRADQQQPSQLYVNSQGEIVSPSQPAIIIRDWSSCALAAAAAAKRRPAAAGGVPNHPQQQQQPSVADDQQPSPSSCPSTPVLSRGRRVDVKYDGSTLPNFHLASREDPSSSAEMPNSNLISLLRAYNIANATHLASRLAQFNVGTIEQLAQVTLHNQSHMRRILRKVAANAIEHQRLNDLVFDLVNIAGGHYASSATSGKPANKFSNNIGSTNGVVYAAANSSTDSGVYGSDGDVPSSGENGEVVAINENTLRDYLARAQIDLASLPYSDKFGFGHIQADWSMALAEVLGFEPISTAVALDRLRLDSLRKSSRIGIPQKELSVQVSERLRGPTPPSRNKPPVDPNTLRLAGRKQELSYVSLGGQAQRGSLSLHRPSKQHTISQPLLPSLLHTASSRHVDILCDCRSPECVRL